MTSFSQMDTPDILREKASCLTMEEALNVIEIYRDVPGHGPRFVAAARWRVEALNGADRKVAQGTETSRYRVMLWLTIAAIVLTVVYA